MNFKKPGLYKNWPAICQLQDANMRIIISLCQEPAILSKLADMYPECFSVRKVPPKIPQSAIMWMSRQQAVDKDLTPLHQEYYAKFMWQNSCNALGLQLERYRRPNTSGKDFDPNAKNAFDQLHGKVPQPGMEIDWDGKKYIVVQIEIRPEDTDKPLPKTWMTSNLMLVPAEQIDRNS